jgi:hypothetical protein
MNCRKFQKTLVDHWPFDAEAGGPAAEHLRACKRCAELVRFLYSCRVAPGEGVSAAEAERSFESVKRSLTLKRPARERGLIALSVAAAIILMAALATLLYFYGPPVNPAPPAERVKRVEMYIHKTGTPESQAVYLYLEVHQKEKP